jgi:carbamoyl-phosphate synthase large subunit
MPRRDDIRRILVLGSGPIVIGQACEFDYSGTQAVKALVEDGYEVALLNSNPATIMTDPEIAALTFVAPLVPEVLEQILATQKIDAILPTVGGQTALNLAVAASRQGMLEKYGVELIGAAVDVIARAEDREQFKQAMLEIGLDVPRSHYCRSLEQARVAVGDLGYPVIIRPSFTMGGSGAAVAYNREEFDSHVQFALGESPDGELLLEESVLGWKEYEL